jgi:nitroimidazol reductase NimA-like FMN-containing flavoprotein (pyridoxamine 5'-phosphate oxidase superfamily)
MRDPQIYNTWTEEQIQLYLADHRIGRLGTIDEEGFPHVVPMWYVLFEGLIYFSTRVPRKKIGNLRNNPNISFTVDSGERLDDYQGVLIQGRAEIIEDPEVLRRYNIAFAHRHCGSEEHPYARLLSAHKVRIVRLAPVHVLTWDYRGMAK